MSQLAPILPAASRSARMALMLALACAAAPALSDSGAVPPERSGEQLVKQVCVQCHGTGANGAPRIGDAAAWKSRASQGLSGLTKHAIAGLRKMPPHGGKMDTSDLELERAITYMVNQSGGHWTEPIDRARPPKERTGEQIVQAQCHKCHEKGVNGAPRIGDRKEWIRRAGPGLDSLVRSAINGHGGMPARGGMANLTDAEMRAAITYMFQTSVKHPTSP
jgi:cytochrome c5